MGTTLREPARKAGVAVRRLGSPIGIVSTAGIALVYIALGFLAYLPIWEHGWTRWMLQVNPGDPVLSVWYLAWTPYALAHGSSLLFTHHLNAPYGLNLAWQTAVPILGLALAPLTIVAGPVASYNLAMTLAPAAAALSLYFVAVRLGLRRPPAMVGGYIYGFGPFMLGQGLSHLHLVSSFLFPLIFYKLHRSVVADARRPLIDGITLGGLLVAQYFISSEMLSDAAVLTLIGLVLYVATAPRCYRHVVAALPTFLIAGVVAAAALAYPAWFLLHGPQHVDKLSGLSVFSSSLLGVVVPTSNELLHATPWLASANAAVSGALDENGTYLGIPLVMLLLWSIARLRKQRRSAFWAALALVSVVMSLGPALIVVHRSTAVSLPTALLEQLPLLGAAVPVRYSLFADMFSGLAAAAVLSGIGSRTTGGLRWPSLLGSMSVAALVIVPVLPGLWPYPSGPTAVPEYFRSTGTSKKSHIQTVVTYPFVAPLHDQAMLWQATARLRFKLVGAYAVVPIPGGGYAYQPVPSLLEVALRAYYLGLTPLPMSAANISAERTDLSQWGATTLVAAPLGAKAEGAKHLFTVLAGHGPVWDRGVWVWALQSAPRGS